MPRIRTKHGASRRRREGSDNRMTEIIEWKEKEERDFLNVVLNNSHFTLVETRGERERKEE